MGEIRFVGTGETRGYPYLVCKKEFSSTAKSRTHSFSKVSKRKLPGPRNKLSDSVLA